MSETRSGGGGRKAKAKARTRAAAAGESPAASAAAKTMSAEVSAAPKSGGKKAKKAAAAKPPPASEPEPAPSPSPTKKKKRKRIHKSKNGGAAASATAVDDEDGEQLPPAPVEKQEPKKKKQPAKKVTEKSAKAAKDVAAPPPATPSATATVSKSARKRVKRSASIAAQDEAQEEAEERKVTAVSTPAKKAKVELQPKGRTTRASLAAAAAAVAMEEVPPVQQEAEEQLTPATVKPKKKKKKGKAARTASAEPQPTADQDENPSVEVLTARKLSASEITAPAHEGDGDATSQPARRIISLAKVKGSRHTSDSLPTAEDVGVTIEERSDSTGAPSSVAVPPPDATIKLGSLLEDPTSSVQPTSKVAPQEDAWQPVATEDQVARPEENERPEQDIEEPIIPEPQGESTEDVSTESVEEGAWDQTQDGAFNPSARDIDEVIEETLPETEEQAMDAQDEDIGMVDDATFQRSAEAIAEQYDGEFDEDDDAGKSDDRCASDSEMVDSVDHHEDQDDDTEDMEDAENLDPEFAPDIASSQVPTSIDEPVDGESEEDGAVLNSTANYESDAELTDSDDEADGENDYFDALPGMNSFQPSETSVDEVSTVILLSSDSDTDSDASEVGEAEAEDAAAPEDEARNEVEDAEEDDEEAKSMGDQSGHDDYAGEVEEIDDDQEDENHNEQAADQNRSNAASDEEFSVDTGLHMTVVDAADYDAPYTSTFNQSTAPTDDFYHGEESKTEDEPEDERSQSDVDERSHKSEVERTESEHDAEEDSQEEDDDDDEEEEAIATEAIVQRALFSHLLSPSDEPHVSPTAISVPEEGAKKGDVASLCVSPASPPTAAAATHSVEKRSGQSYLNVTATLKASPNVKAESKITYSTTPSKHLIDSVLSSSPGALVASIAQSARETPFPQRKRPQDHTWGLSFGISESPRVNVTGASPEAPPLPAVASPLSSWFFSRGPANFKKRVLIPTPESPRQRIGSPRPLKKARVDAEGKTESDSEPLDPPPTGVEKFVQGLLEKSAWRSWYSTTEPDQLLDAPLPPAMVKRLGGEAVVAQFMGLAAMPPPRSAAPAVVPSQRKLALAQLEQSIREEKRRAQAFDQELLLLLQGKTLAGQDLQDEFAALLPAATQ